MGCQEGITYNHETILKEKHLVVFYICVCVCVCVYTGIELRASHLLGLARQSLYHLSHSTSSLDSTSTLWAGGGVSTAHSPPTAQHTAGGGP
jgi:hypothetical protein